MKIHWNRVTWYSRTLAAALFAAVFLLGFFLGVRYEQKLVQPLERDLEQKTDIVNWLDRILLLEKATHSQLAPAQK